jgi:hypothetical protein
MSDDTAKQPSEETAPPRAARQRAPKSPEAKTRGLAARKLQRQLEALKASKDAAKLERAAEELAKLAGDESPSDSGAVPTNSATPASDAPPAPKEQLRATPQGVNPRGPAWPAEATIAEFAPMVKQGVDMLGALLQGTRFDFSGAVEVQVGEAVVSRSKAETLTAGLTPLAAKYLPTSINTPEAAAVMALLAVFGAPLIQLATDKLSATRQGAGAA